MGLHRKHFCLVCLFYTRIIVRGIGVGIAAQTATTITVFTFSLVKLPGLFFYQQTIKLNVAVE